MSNNSYLENLERLIDIIEKQQIIIKSMFDYIPPELKQICIYDTADIISREIKNIESLEKSND